MIMKRIGLDNSINRRKVKVYNVDTKELLGEFKSTSEASAFSGVRAASIPYLIKNKSKNRVNSLGCTLAFR